jgi:hypothetical protein
MTFKIVYAEVFPTHKNIILDIPLASSNERIVFARREMEEKITIFNGTTTLDRIFNNFLNLKYGFLDSRNKEYRARENRIKKELEKISKDKDKMKLLFKYFQDGIITRSQIKVLGNINEWELADWDKKLKASYRACISNTN